MRDNPYILATEHIGGSFAEADTMALEMGVDSYSKNRICAAVLFELVHNSGNGHCFIPREKLAAVTAQLIGVDEPSADECIDILIESGQLMHEEIAGCKACYLPSLYHAESDRQGKESLPLYGTSATSAEHIDWRNLRDYCGLVAQCRIGGFLYWI